MIELRCGIEGVESDILQFVDVTRTDRAAQFEAQYMCRVMGGNVVRQGDDLFRH